MNPNEEQFPEGTRVKITEQYGAWAENYDDVSEEYTRFHGQEAVVVSYADVSEPFVRIGLDTPPEKWAETLLMHPNEIEVL